MHAVEKRDKLFVLEHFGVENDTNDERAAGAPRHFIAVHELLLLLFERSKREAQHEREREWVRYVPRRPGTGRRTGKNDRTCVPPGQRACPQSRPRHDKHPTPRAFFSTMEYPSSPILVTTERVY